jgi:hypothetical protein
MTIQLYNTTINLESFVGMSKEEFIEGNYSGDLDVETTWESIQREIKKYDVPSITKQSGANKKGK